MTIDQILQKALYEHKNGDLKKAEELYKRYKTGKKYQEHFKKQTYDK